MKRLLLSATAVLALAPASAQTVLQAGPWAKGHAPVYASPGGSQPFLRDAGPAGGGPVSSAPGLTEGLYIVPPAPGGAPAPWANTGTGPNGTNWCDYDGPPANGAYHYLCLSPNADGGALIAYGAVGTAPLPLSFNINGDVGQPLLGINGVLPISRGGTGASTQAGALTNILDGSIIQVVNGGTGASTPPGARANLGLGPNIMVLASDAGMKDDGVTDNAPFTQALMNAVMPVTNGGTHVVFAPTNGIVNSPYYFSAPLRISRAGTWDCGGYSPPRAVAGTTLVFAPGVDGVRLEDAGTSPDGGNATAATFENCGIYSLGFGLVPGGITTGSNQIVTAMQGFGTISQPGYIGPSSWSAGDGFVVWGGFTTSYNVTSDVVTTGAFSGTGSITAGVLTITVASSGTLVDGSPISYAGVPTNAGGLWITSQLTGSPGGVGTYQLNRTLPNFASGTITSAYGILTIPPTVPTAATASFILGDTTISVTTSTCSGIVPGETLQDTQSGVALNLGTVKYCVPGGPSDTVTLNAGSLHTSVGGTDSLKFVSVTTGKITPLSSWEVISGGAPQQALGTYVYAQVSSSEIAGVLGGGGVYTLSAAQPAVTKTTSDGRNLEFAPASPPGSYIDSATGAAGAQTLTVHTGFEPTITNTSTNLGGIWQLPAIQGYRITTTAGLSTFTVTAGPSAAPTRMLEPGDFIDSAPFAYGCAVFQVSGSGGSQSVTLGPSAVVTTVAGTTPCAASSSGSYTLWELPSGLRMPNLGHLLYNYVRGFAWGFNLYSSSGSIPPGNGTGSYVADNAFENSVVGFMDAGDNTSGSLYLKNLGKHSYFVDFARLGLLGNGHIGDNGNGAEDGQASLVLAVFCGSQNNDVELGNYFGGGSAWAPACIPNTGMLFQPTSATANPTQWLISPSAAAPPGTPVLSKNGLTNALFAFAPDLGSPGIYFNSNSENATSSPPFRMNMTTSSTQSASAGLAWFYNPLFDDWQTNMSGVSTLGLAADVWGAGTGWVPAGGYSGASASAAQGRYHEFPLGFMMGGATIGGERLIDSGTAAQSDTSTSITASQAFLTTNTIIAVSSTTGVTVGYTPIDTTISATTMLGTVRSSNSTQNWVTLTGVSTHASSGATDTLLFDGGTPIPASDFYGVTMTKIPVASCVGVSGGQAVTDLTDASAAVGTVSACGTQATMILANTAGAGTASSGTGDTIVVTLRRQGDFRFNLTPTVSGAEGWAVTDNIGTVAPAGLIAGDNSGKVWPTTSVKTTIAALPSCTSGISGNNGVVTNGTAVGVGTYGTAVSATGAATRKVFCDGTGWLYD